MSATKNEAISAGSTYPRWLAIFLFVPAITFSLTYWLSGAFFLFVMSLITRPFLNASQHCRLGNKILGTLFIGFFKGLTWLQIVKIDDEELNPYCDMPGPLIVASNHPSLWDAPMLIQRFIHISCIMKVEILNNVILSSGSRFAGFVPNLPTLTMVRKATEHLNRGGRLLLFPEGTRTREEHTPCNPFRQGMALLAKNADCPILPVFILMNSGYMRKGWPIWKMPPIPISVSIKVGDLQRIENEEDTHQFSERLEDYFSTSLIAMDPWKKDDPR